MADGQLISGQKILLKPLYGLNLNLIALPYVRYRPKTSAEPSQG